MSTHAAAATIPMIKAAAAGIAAAEVTVAAAK
jgi:hypothetical protein